VSTGQLTFMRFLLWTIQQLWLNLLQYKYLYN